MIMFHIFLFVPIVRHISFSLLGMVLLFLLFLLFSIRLQLANVLRLQGLCVRLTFHRSITPFVVLIMMSFRL